MSKLVLMLGLLLACEQRQAHAGDWQENFSYEKVALIHKIDTYRGCVAAAPSRESMRSCQY